MSNIKTELIEIFEDEGICESLMFGECDIDDIRDFTFEQVAHFGGEGQGSKFYAVWKITRSGETVYVRFDGYYQSHYGTDYQGWKFVEPKQKTITVYE